MLNISDTTAVVEPTADSDSSPSFFPTIIMSTRLYACWNRLPSRIGRLNRSISRIMLPFVRSLIVSSFLSVALLLFF